MLFLMVIITVAGTACGPPDEELIVAQGTWPVHTVCGGSSTIPGIDVSKWQSTINWQAVKSSGKVFSIARVSDGTTYIDGYFKANWTGMKKVGLIRGAYQFFRPNQDPLAQANLFVQKINEAGGMEAGDMPPVLDLEKTGGVTTATAVKNVDIWLGRVKQLTNRVPIIYTGSYFWDGNKFGTKHTKYPLWTAHYTTKPCPLVPNPWSAWTIWQYTSSAKVSGISGNVDANRFNGTLSDLKQFIKASVINAPLPPDAGVPDKGAPVKPDKGVPVKPDRGALVKSDTGHRTDAGPIPTRDDSGLAPGLEPDVSASGLTGQHGTTLIGQGCSLGGGAPAASPTSAGSPALPLILLLGLALARRVHRSCGARDVS